MHQGKQKRVNELEEEKTEMIEVGDKWKVAGKWPLGFYIRQLGR